MEAERAAVKRAITMLGHEPVMAEDFEARASSPQVACRRACAPRIWQRAKADKRTRSVEQLCVATAPKRAAASYKELVKLLGIFGHQHSSVATRTIEHFAKRASA